MKLLLLEVWGLFFQVPLVWWLFRRFGRRNVTGEMMAAAIIGVVWEVATEPLWDYHFRVTFYRDAPVAVITGWMVMLMLIVCLSEKLYKVLLKKPRVAYGDKRIFVFDVVSAAIVALPMETAGAKLGVWTYRQDLLKWDWGYIPFFNMPVELLFGYSLLMLVAPTFIRYWQRPFEEDIP